MGYMNGGGGRRGGREGGSVGMSWKDLVDLGEGMREEAVNGSNKFFFSWKANFTLFVLCVCVISIVLCFSKCLR